MTSIRHPARSELARTDALTTARRCARDQGSSKVIKGYQRSSRVIKGAHRRAQVRPPLRRRRLVRRARLTEQLQRALLRAARHQRRRADALVVLNTAPALSWLRRETPLLAFNGRQARDHS